MNELALYANLPTRPLDLAPLFADIRDAKERLIVASAWFTDDDIAIAIIGANARQKIVILNQGDLQRERSHKAVNRLRRWPDESLRVVILGSGDWTEGVMHMKFILADDAVWLGSYNFTWQARKNYELLLRVEDSLLAEQLDGITTTLINDRPLWPDAGDPSGIGHGAFRCGICQYVKNVNELASNNGSWWSCRDCENAFIASRAEAPA